MSYKSVLEQVLILWAVASLVACKGHKGDEHDPIPEPSSSPQSSCSGCCIQGQIGAAMGELSHIVRLVVREEIAKLCPNCGPGSAKFETSPTPSLTRNAASTAPPQSSQWLTDEASFTPHSINPSKTLPGSTVTHTVTTTVAVCPSASVPPAPPGPSPCVLGQTEANPALSCADILNCNPEADTGDYWILTRNGSQLVYCLMDANSCGERGFMRVANINTDDQEQTCPDSLTTFTAVDSKNLTFCGPRAKYGCSGVSFDTFGLNFSRVCGRAVGYSYHHPCGFYMSGWQGLEGAYVSGLSITHGQAGQRSHIWTYASGYHEEAHTQEHNCPCAKYRGKPSPSYVGDDFYCESATTQPPPLPQMWFTDNALWDGEKCTSESNCCDRPNAPWFIRELNSSVAEDIEVRWCTTQGLHYDRVGTELVEVYVY